MKRNEPLVGVSYPPLRGFGLSVLVLLAAIAPGCSKSGPAVGKVTGTVTYQGKPVPNATVTFLPSAEGGQAAIGITDNEGVYQLSTFGKNDGALVGSHRGNVVARKPYEGKLPEGAGEALLEELQTQGDPLIPQRYFSTETSGLNFEVKAGSNTIDIPLSD